MRHKKRRPRYQLTHDKFFSKEEQAMLMTAIESLQERDKLIIELALATGARENEILSITPQDLVVYKRVHFVQITALKGSRDRLLPIQPELFARLKALGGNNALVFGISDSRLRQIWLKIRPVAKKFHALRHTFAVNLFEKTKNLKTVQSALGHTSLLNTTIYLDFVTSTDGLIEAML